MPGPCATQQILPAVRPPVPPVPPATRWTLLEGKATRNPLSVPNSIESENFVLRWGNDGAPAEQDRSTMLTALERSWSVQVDEMGHPPPETADSIKVNVYVGDTGDGAPPGYGAAGYYTPDSEGYPMIVLARETVAAPETGVLTVAHEFYHAVQWATGSYDYGEGAAGAWYWEATASWIETEVYPDNPAYAVFLFGYALLPHLPVDFFDYPDTGALQEYHQYGAFIFPQYLSEFAGGPGLIRDSWVQPQADSRDPLVNLDVALRAQGSDLGSAFSSFAARNATWDYADGATYEAYVETYGAYFPSEDGGVAAREQLGSEQDLGWRAVPTPRLPQRYGYTLVEVEVQGDVETARVLVETDPVGSEGSEAEWGLSLVTRQGEDRTYEVLVPDETGLARMDVAMTEGATLWLVAAAWSEALRPGETFSWRYRLLDADSVSSTDGTDDSGGPTDTSEPPQESGRPASDRGGAKGCSISGGLALPGAGLWAALLVVGRRRP